MRLIPIPDRGVSAPHIGFGSFRVIGFKSPPPWGTERLVLIDGKHYWVKRGRVDQKECIVAKPTKWRLTTGGAAILSDLSAEDFDRVYNRGEMKPGEMVFGLGVKG